MDSHRISHFCERAYLHGKLFIFLIVACGLAAGLGDLLKDLELFAKLGTSSDLGHHDIDVYHK